MKLLDTLLALPGMEDWSRARSSGGGEAPPQERLKGELRHVRAAVAAIPNDYEAREEYLDIGYAIKAALPDYPDDAFQLFGEWCSRWRGNARSPRGNDPATVAADWERMKSPFRRGAHWLYELAEERSGGTFRIEQTYFEPIDGEILLPGEGDPWTAAGPTAAGRDPSRSLEPITFQDAARSALEESTRPLIKGFLDQGTLSVLYGESNVGKTFLAMDIAFHIAAGLPWGGMKTTSAAVLYIAAEGGRGARRRAAALARKFGSEAAGARFHFIIAPVNLLDPTADLSSIIAAIRGIGFIGFIVVDTLSRVLAGGEENSSADMGALVRNLDRLRATTGAHVMVVHHAGKNLARGARGHSLLRAATDTEIEVADGQLSVTKQRDLDKEFRCGFVLEIVQLGSNGDGDAITSCTVKLLGKNEVPRGTATPAEQVVLDAVVAIEALNTRGANGVSSAEIVEFLKESQPDLKADTARKHMTSLEKKRLLRKVNAGKWAWNRPPPEPSTFFSPVHDDAALENHSAPGGRSVFT